MSKNHKYLVLEAEGFQVTAQYSRKDSRESRHYYEYWVYDTQTEHGKVQLGTGVFSPAPSMVDWNNPEILTERGAVNLLGFFTDDQDSLKHRMGEEDTWVTPELVHWAGTSRHDELALYVSDKEGSV